MSHDVLPLHTHRADQSAGPGIVCATLYDEAFASIGWMCRNTLTRYGQKYGHDVISARSVVCDRPAPWHKVRLVQALFEYGYDHVFWVDADAVVLESAPDVANLIIYDKDLHLVKHAHTDYPEGVPNTGVFLIRNCRWSYELLSRMWSLKQYANATWWENAALIDLLGLGGFEDVGIPPRTEGAIDERQIQWLSERWNRLDREAPDGHAFVRHAAGRSKRYRLKTLPRWVNWPRALLHEATRKPTPVDLTRYGIHGAVFHHKTDDSLSPPSDQVIRRAA